MALEINTTAVPLFEVNIIRDGKQDYLLSVPMMKYLPMDVAKATDQWIVDRNKQVQANRDKANAEKTPFSAIDPDYAYPQPLDVMDKILEMVDAEGAKIVAELSVGFREQIQKAWDAASPETDLGKSEASSDSSDATE